MPSASAWQRPPSISRAMRSAASRFALGMLLGSSFVVYISSLKVLVIPYIRSFTANWSQVPTSAELPRWPETASAASLSDGCQVTSSRPSPELARFWAISPSVAKPLAGSPGTCKRPAGGGTSTAETCRKSLPGMMSVLITSPLFSPFAATSLADLSVME